MLTRSHKIELDPTIKQVVYFKRAGGTARFTYNWALARWNELYQQRLTTNALALKDVKSLLSQSH